MNELPPTLTFIDVETTGFNPWRDRIIEIALLKFENEELTHSFHSLIDPEIHIPAHITNMTGIDLDTIRSAPTFPQIADKVLELLDNSVFIAHNVNFDYGFVRAEFERVGFKFSSKRLCTVRLSKVVSPRAHHHNLNAVLKRHNIKCNKRHTAMGDIQATADFFWTVKHKLNKERFFVSLQQQLKQPYIPTQLQTDTIQKLPNTTGVYIFYGDEKTPLYIGKSKRIRDRVHAHFSSPDGSPKTIKLLNEITHIDYVVTAGELGAFLREERMIKEQKPLYNKHLRRQRIMVLARIVTDENGYNRIQLETSESIQPHDAGKIAQVFRSTKQAKTNLSEIAKEHNLCDKLLGLEKTSRECFGYHLGRCHGACVKKEAPLSYNGRLEEVFKETKIRMWPYSSPILIREYNEEYDLSEVHLIDNWCYLGSAKTQQDLVSLESAPTRFELDTYKILKRFLTLPNTSVSLAPILS